MNFPSFFGLSVVPRKKAFWNDRDVPFGGQIIPG